MEDSGLPEKELSMTTLKNRDEKAKPASAVSSSGRDDIEQKQEAGVVSTKTTSEGCLRQSQPGG